MMDYDTGDVRECLAPPTRSTLRNSTLWNS